MNKDVEITAKKKKAWKNKLKIGKYKMVFDRRWKKVRDLKKRRLKKIETEKESNRF